MADRLLQDVLAGRASGGAAGDDALQPAQALEGVVIDLLPGPEGGPEAFERLLRASQTLLHLGRRRVLAVATGSQLGAKVGEVGHLALGPSEQARDQHRHGHRAGDHCHKQQREQQFEERHVAIVCRTVGPVKAC